jgi:hypothetical protein
MDTHKNAPLAGNLAQQSQVTLPINARAVEIQIEIAPFSVGICTTSTRSPISPGFGELQ